MKHLRNVLALVLAAFVALVVAAPAFAATITVTPPENTDASAKNTYTIYKVFDATVSATDSSAISYTLPSGITQPPTGFSVDTAGNVTLTRTDGDLTKLTDAEIAAIKAYIDANSIAGTNVTVTGTAPAEFGNLAAGYYYITTTTGTLVVVESNNSAVEVEDKNTVPSLTKEILEASGEVEIIDELGKKAIAEVGTDVQFESVITVGKGMKDYKFYDTMDDGLKLNTNSITVTYSAKPAGYVEATPVADADAGTIVIEFNNGLAEGTTITINYSATVTNEALTYQPEKNTAYVKYGNGPTVAKTPEQQTETYSAKISVIKKDGQNTQSTDDDTPLAGAKFKLYRLVGSESYVAAGDEFDAKATYYTENDGEYTAADVTAETFAELKDSLFVKEEGSTKEYYKLNAAANGNPATITWGDTGDEHEADAQGNVPAFIGLNDGTYYLEESFTPAGYNTVDDVEVTIAGKDYTQSNLEQQKTVINNKGSVLPSTGGMGTTILYTIGGIMLVGGAIALVSKKRVANMEK